MAIPDFAKGRESLLQSLALLKDDEEFRGKYGHVPEVMAIRREKSISLLCDTLVRMKTESDVKKKCVDLLEDVSKWWKLMLEDREKLTQRISELDKVKKRFYTVSTEDRENLEKKVEQLKEQVKYGNSCSRCDRSTSEYGEKNQDVTLDRTMGENSEESNEAEVLKQGNKPVSSRSRRVSSVYGKQYTDDDTPSQILHEHDADSRRSEETNNFYSRHFDGNFEINREENNHKDQYDNDTQDQSQISKADFTHPLLTCNPYERLDTQYYNPSQFFQRQSSTFKQSLGKPRGRGRGSRVGASGGRKKTVSEAAGSVTAPTKKAKRGGKAGSEKQNTSTREVVDITVESLKGSSFNGDIEEQEKSIDYEEKSQEHNYFDYSSTFLDATEIDLAE